MESDTAYEFCENIVPFELRRSDALPLDVFRTPERSDEVIECKDQRAVGERAEFNRIIDIIDHGGKGPPEPFVVFGKISPHIQGAERKYSHLIRPIWNPVHTKVFRRDTANISGGVDLLAKQCGVKLLAGFGGLFFHGEQAQRGEADLSHRTVMLTGVA